MLTGVERIEREGKSWDRNKKRGIIMIIVDRREKWFNMIIGTYVYWDFVKPH